MRHLIFALVLLAGMGGLAFTVGRLIRFMWVGRPGIPVDRLPERLGSVVLYWLLQRKVMEKPMDKPKFGFTSLHHLGIFWGFLIVTVGTVELWVNGLTGLSFSFLPAVIFHPLEWVIDVFNLVVLVAIGYGFFRRLVVKPRLIPMSLDAGIILSAIAGLMITHFCFHGFHMLASGTVGEEGPVSTVVAGWLGLIGVFLGPLFLLCALEFVGRDGDSGWKVAETLTPGTYVVWSIWLIATGAALLF